jgi:serine/threonine protein kinase
LVLTMEIEREERSPAQDDVLAGYRLGDRIGAGGMGSVYTAVHLATDRHVAIKVLADKLVRDEDYLSRFLSEAKLVRELDHPNIIRLFELIDLPSPTRRVAYVMELIEGPTLGMLIGRRALTPRQAVNIALQLADALGEFHRHGVVHRDLKPENILVLGSAESDFAVRPSVKILDFGVAKWADPSAEHHTATGAMLGTPIYMAPEQITGGKVSPATDVYAFGEILFEMLSRKVMYGQDLSSSYLARLSGRRPVLPGVELLECHAELDELIDACVRLEPNQRLTVPAIRQRLRAIRKKLSGEGSDPADTDGTLCNSLDDQTTIVQPPVVQSRPRRIHAPVLLALLLMTGCTIAVFALRGGLDTTNISPEAAAPTPTQVTRMITVVSDVRERPPAGSPRQANNGRAERDLSTVLEPGLPAGSPRQAPLPIRRAPPKTSKLKSVHRKAKADDGARVTKSEDNARPIKPEDITPW